MPAWSVRFETRAERDLAKLAKQDRERVLRFLHDRVASSPSPRSFGAALVGPYKSLWKYRVGDIRIIADIRDGDLIVLIVEIGNRREIYR